MIKCQYCGYENSDNLEYCINCSKHLPTNESSKVFDASSMTLNDLYDSSVENLNLASDSSYSDNQDFILNDDNALFISTLLSLIIPGSGLIYLKHHQLGFAVFVLTIILWTFTQVLYFVAKISIVHITLSLSIILYLLNIIYTYKIAEENYINKIKE